MARAGGIKINESMNSTSNSTLDQMVNNASDVWLASVTFTFVVALLLIYVIIALSYHGYKYKSLIGCKNAALSKKERNTAVVNSLILFAAATTFVYVGIAIPLTFHVDHPYCVIQHRVKITVFAMSLFSVYTALWYRVYTSFYANPILKQVTTKALRCINLSAMLFLCVLLIVNLTLFYLSPGYKTTPKGCKHIQSKDASHVKWILLVITTIVFQTTLLFSFVYPLTLHNRNMSTRGFDVKPVLPVIKRATFVAAICVVSDLANAGFAVAYTGQTTYINHMVYSCNLCINLLGFILSFSDWKEKILPCDKCIETMKAEIVASSTAAISKLNFSSSYSSHAL